MTLRKPAKKFLKRIALAGYDSDIFLAPDDIYAKLPGCCQYDRVRKTANIAENQPLSQSLTGHKIMQNHLQTNKLKLKLWIILLIQKQKQSNIDKLSWPK